MKFNSIELPYHFENSKEQGLTNDLFILNNDFFVKCSKPLTKAFLDWENEINVIALIKTQPFTLPILETQIFEDKLWILMPYYQNLSTLADHKINQEILQQLAKLVKYLHTTKIKPKNKIKKWEPLAQLNLYCNLVQINTNNLGAIKNELEIWLKSYQPEKIVLSHNDLVINNFVFHQEKWYLIDWDFATLNDPLFDIASFASETLKTDQDINYWYQLFQLSQKDLTIVNYWIKYQNLIWYHWAIFLYQKTKNKIYHTIAEAKIKQLK
ncbi:MAG: phosphotransferase [Spiroplasma sp.]